MSLNHFHEMSWLRMHEAFAPAHSPIALCVCVTEESGELAAAILGVTGEKKRKVHLTKADILDAVADCFTYLALLAYSLGQKDLDSMLPKVFCKQVDLQKTVLNLSDSNGRISEYILDNNVNEALFWAEQSIDTLYDIAYTCDCIDVQKLIIDTFNMVSNRAGSKYKVL